MIDEYDKDHYTCSPSATGIKSGEYIHKDDLIYMRQKFIELCEKRNNPANNAAGSLSQNSILFDKVKKNSLSFNDEGFIIANNGDNSIDHIFIINDYSDIHPQD